MGLRRLRALALCAVIGLLMLVGYAGAVIVNRADGLVVSDVSEVPHHSVVIVPGALVDPDGEPAGPLEHRLEAAAELFDRGTVDHVLVSGDNSVERYNEPVVMRNWLVEEADLSPRDVTLDYAGFDTWDTCLRAREQFGVVDAVVVTQRRYADRTAALCQAVGIDTVVLTVASPPQSLPTRTRLIMRERLAAVKAWGDLILTPPARYGGDVIGLIGSEGMPEGGHPPDWDYQAQEAG